MKHLTLSLLLFATMLLAGCTVGPKYARPDVPTAPVLLIKALGGGWSVSELPKTAALR